MTQPAVSVRRLRKVYRSRRRGDTVAVEGIDFDVEPGEVVGLLGPNGAGKTTTIKCLCTLLTPTAGEISIAGVDALSRPREALWHIAAVLEGNRNIYWRLTPRENLEFFAGLQGLSMRAARAGIEQLIEQFGLSDKANTPARMLSRGMQQKLAVACALVKRTEILLLDEPTLGLDVTISHELRSILKSLAQREARTILLSSHDMGVVQDLCDRVIIINRGRIVTDDRVENLLALFRAKAYEFSLSGRLDEGQSRRLMDRFEMIEITPNSERTSLRVELLDADELYDLIGMLRESGCAIESVDRQEPNLEEVFLRVIREGER